MNRRLFFATVLFLSAGLLFIACSAPDISTMPNPITAENSTTLDKEASAAFSESGDDVIVDGTPPPDRVVGLSDWSTDFTRRTVDWDEILSGGPPKDGIPAVDDPLFESVEAAATWLTERDPVIVFSHEGESRAYPLSILIWHEIVNDEINGLPISVTFCPLCNASIVFDRRFEGQILDFGTTGNLRNSDLIMYDRQSETWWQQFTGEGIVGDYAGEQLTFLPTQVISFGEFRSQFSEGTVLARPEGAGGFARSYGRNPYVGYDSNDRPFLYRGEIDDRLPAVERVVGLTTEDAARAYGFGQVADEQVVNDEFGGASLVIFHKSGQASALDSSNISQGRDIGSVAVFERTLPANGGAQTLTFAPGEGGLFMDNETGSTWDILGQAVDGPLAGEQLTPILHFDHFWFAWAAFFPETEVWGGG